MKTTLIALLFMTSASATASTENFRIQGAIAEALFKHLTGYGVRETVTEPKSERGVQETRKGENIVCTSELIGQEPTYLEHFCEITMDENGETK